MSLESAILENTATLRELIARLTNTALAAPVTAEDLPITKKKDPAKPASEDKANDPNPSAGEPVQGTVTAAVDEEPASYEDVKKLILELSKVKGSKVAVSVLGLSGATKGPELKPEKFAEFVANARKELGVV